MKRTAIIEQKILSDLRGLPAEKMLEAADFIEYLKVRQTDWRVRFKSFLGKIEPKMKKVSYADVAKEISKTRGK
ncbi:MAG: hypothetical protein ABIJ26_04755 [Candidatus Margulisiibacteriota bacterium]|nr:hypothetical protein [Candidatus Margulisiibacteriota bacterium]